MLDMAHNRIDSGNGAENTNSALSAYARRFNNVGAVARDNRTKALQNAEVVEESNATVDLTKGTENVWETNWFLKGLATIGDVFMSGIEGIVKGVEGIVDFGAQAVAQVASWTGNTGAEQAITDFVKSDWLGSGGYYNSDFYVTMTNASLMQDMGIVGDVIKGVAQGVGQMAPSIAVSLIPGAGTAAGMATFTAGAMGGGAEEAYLDGATTEEASLYGLLSGAVEAGTEILIGGGLGAMGGSSVLQKGLRKVAKNTTVQKALQFLGGAIGEGIEEIASDLINPVIKRVYDENSFDAYTDPEFASQLIYDGIVGALTGMVLNVSQLTTRRQTNATYQELKTLEEKAENIKNNKRLSPEKKQAQLAEIQEQIRNKQNLYADNINKLSKKSETKPKDVDKTLFNAANTYLNIGEDGKYKAKDLDRNFSDSVSYGVTNADIETYVTKKGNKLYEGTFAGDTAKRHSDFNHATRNLNKIAENGRIKTVVVENINNGEVVGKKITDAEGKIYGYIEEGSNVIILSKDAFDADLDFTFTYGNGKTVTKKVNAAISTLLHEVTHFSENTKEYNELRKFVINNIDLGNSRIAEIEQSYGLNEDTYRVAREKINEGKGEFENLSEAETTAMSEVMAVSIESLLADENYINRLTQDNTTLAKRILNKIRNMWSVIKGDGKNEKVLRSILKTAEKLYNKAIANAIATTRNGIIDDDENGEIQYNLKENLETLGYYTKEETRHIEQSGRDIIAHSYEDVQKFIQNSLNSEKGEKRLHLGKMNNAVSEIILSETGVDVRGYDIVFDESSVKHIFNKHGSNTEVARGQIQVTYENFENLLDAIVAPDNVKVNTSKDGAISLTFEKNENGKNIAVTIMSTKRNTLSLKTAYIIKKETVIHRQSTADSQPQTSETNGRNVSFTNSIREENGNVNTQNEKITNISTEGIDNRNKTQYSIKGDTDYERTDDFRRIQEKSRGMSDREVQEYRAGKRVSEEVRRRLSRTFELEINAAKSERIYSERSLLNPKTGKSLTVIENVNGNLFHDIFEVSRNYLENGELVDLHHNYDNATCYLSNNGLSGFAITESGDLISVFNLNNERGFLKTIAPIVKEKAKTLDCYNSTKQPLRDIYSTIFGFKTASLMDYNIEYDHDNIAKNHGMPQVAFMVNTETEVDTKTFNKDQYDAAVEYQQSFVRHTSENKSNIKYSIKRNSAAEAQYNKYGWAKENNVVNNKEYRDFFERMSDFKNGAVYPQDSDGNYIIAVGESEVKNTLIFTDGNYESPSVEKVVKINLDNETKLSDTRSDIYASEQFGLSYESNGILEVYTREAYEIRNDARSTGQSVKVGQGERNGRGVSGNTRYSVKTERASAKLTKTIKKTAIQQVDEKINSLLDAHTIKLSDSEKTALRGDEAVKTLRTALHDSMKEDGALPSLKQIREQFPDQYGKFLNSIYEVRAATEAANYSRESIRALFDKNIDKAIANLDKVEFSDDAAKARIADNLAALKLYVMDNCVTIRTDKNGVESRHVNSLTVDNIREIAKLLSAVYNNDNAAIDGRVDSDIIKWLDELKDLRYNALDTRKGRTSAEFKLDRTISMIMHTLSLDDSIDLTGVGGEATTIHAYVEMHLKKLERFGRKNYDKRMLDSLRRVANDFQRNAIDPLAVCRMFDGYLYGGTRDGSIGGITGLFLNVQQGELKAKLETIVMQETVKSFYKEHKGYKSRLTEKITVKDLDGKEISVSRGHMISLYRTLTNKYGMSHAKDVGIRFVERNGQDVSVNNMRFDETALAELENMFNADDIAFVKMTQDFFAYGANLKAEADRYNFGYVRLQEDTDNYYHLTVHTTSNVWKQHYGDTNKNNSLTNYYLDKAANVSIAQSIENDTSTLLAINNVTDVLDTYANQVGMYYGLTKPVDLFMRTLDADVEGMSLRKHLHDIYGNDNAVNYLLKLIEDIQGGKGTTAIDRFLNKLRSNFAKFQLGFNVKVSVSQFSSLPMSFIYLKPSSLIKGAVSSISAISKKSRAEMLQYSEWARVRFATPGGFGVGFVENVGVVSDAAMIGIKGVDYLAIFSAWNGSLNEIANKYSVTVKSLTEAQKQEAGKLLDKIIRDTQPNFGMSNRTGFQRHKNFFVQGLTMFTSDAVKHYSRFCESLGEFRQIQRELKMLREELSKTNAKNAIDALKKEMEQRETELKNSKKRLIKTVSAVVASDIMYAMMCVGIMYLLGQVDDDDKEEWWQKFLQKWGLTTLSTTPIIGSLAEGLFDQYEPGLWITDELGDLYDSMNGWLDIAVSGSPADIPKNLRKTLYSLGQLFGMPLRNMNNLVESVLQVSPYAEFNYKNLFEDNATRSALAKAVESGDDALAQSIIEKMYVDAGLRATSAATKKLYKLFDEGYDVLPKAVSDTITVNDERVELTRAQREKFKKVYSQADSTITKLLSQTSFTSLESGVQAKAIKFVYDYYYDEAKYDLLGVEGDTKKSLFGQVLDIETLAKVYAVASSFEADTDRRGNVINGTKKRKVINYLQSLRLTAAEKYLLLGYLGYVSSNGKSQIINFLRARKLDAEDINLIMTYCGFAA